ncbi:MAG: DUF5343 domain-containing protein [Acidimicrobiales bacterium]
MDTDTNEEAKPPYLPFQTLLNYLGELAGKPLPPKLDRSMMKSKSGGDQTNLIGALKFFGFIDADNTVLEALRTFVPMDETARKAYLGGRLRDLYPEAFKVSDEHGSETALYDCFTETYGYGGDTRRKAATFFLHAARWAGITVSANFPTTRMGSGRAATRGTKRTVVKKGASKVRTPPKPKTLPPSGSGESVEVIFGGLGSATLVIDVPLLSLPESKLTGLLKVVNDLRALSYDEMDEDELYEGEEEDEE